ncbi:MULTISPECIES: fluoride efflux transporter CrcB [Sphingomonadaceae]|uniref:fluoride efflux transporter CrcB n=1 Tax=Sphingomonadaceae TaxID=41297 RepID=UPI001157767C|nr:MULTISPECIES: fluoride efflux transporter CrcB [Sphingomonadaceae]QDK33322.1 fluoride efflux transporter CrcB [Sphingomonas sp. IC081]QSR17973.1 camphor resistance protein CrcB [Novosphingobium sp. KA1]
MPQPSFLLASGLVALGGAVGSWLRFSVGYAWTVLLGPARALAFPYGTLTVNIVGSLVMGLLAGWLGRMAPGGENLRLLVGVGVLGGFTTFSSFSLDTVALAQRGQPGLAVFYVAISLAAGLSALFLGLTIMRSAA